MDYQSTICVIGNGAIGKVAALGFAQAGHSVVLVRPAAKQTAAMQTEAWDTRVYALNHVAHDLLASVRVWDALDASRIAPVEAMAVHGDADGKGGEIEFDAYGARVDALAWIVEDANLNRALDAALRFAPNVRLVDGRSTELNLTAEHATVKLENGSVLRASLVIGADGAQSWVRGQCDIDIEYRPYGQRAVVANFACAQPHHGVAHQWFSATEGVIALLPLPGQRVSLVWSAPEALAETLLEESLSALAQRLSLYCGDTLGALTPLQPEVAQGLPLIFLRPKDITASRVALVGDAAHVIHPLAGQGMNLGFTDVAALLATIAAREPHRDCGDARVLARYARARKEQIFLMQVATDGLERLFATDIEPLRLARTLGMNLLDRLPFVKRGLISQALGK
jgi:2-octaprenylphenol hydroxylase